MSNPFAVRMPSNPFQNLLAMMQGKPEQARSLFAQFSQNPAQALASLGYNIPSNLNTPEQIGQYLVSSGQLSQQSINQMMQLSPQFRSLFAPPQPEPQAPPMQNPFPQFGGRF